MAGLYIYIYNIYGLSNTKTNCKKDTLAHYDTANEDHICEF